jgi:segregation and condensation protein B
MSSESEQIKYSDEEINAIEAILFSSPRPLGTGDLKKLLISRHKGGVKGIIDQLNQKYTDNNNSFRIRGIAGGFQFYLLPDFAIEVERYFSVQRNRRLSPAGLETLAIVAYKQPVTKNEIEQIRGVASDGVIQTLLERKMIKPAGRAERIGKPLLYATTTNFLEYFGINSIEQLPKLSEVLPQRAAGNLQKVLDLSFEQPTLAGDSSDESDSEP